MKQINKNIVKTGRFVGEWHKGPAAPNGCVLGQIERYITEWELYTADYYGKGEKEYLYKNILLETQNGYTVKVGGSSDGNPVAIAKFLESV